MTYANQRTRTTNSRSGRRIYHLSYVFKWCSLSSKNIVGKISLDISVCVYRTQVYAMPGLQIYIKCQRKCGTKLQIKERKQLKFMYRSSSRLLRLEFELIQGQNSKVCLKSMSSSPVPCNEQSTSVMAASFEFSPVFF